MKFMAGLVTAPGAILFGLIPLFTALQCGPCVPPPCTFGLFRLMSREGINIEFKLYAI
jgi:hypothetical protein